MIQLNNISVHSHILIHHVHILYLIIISYILMMFLLPCKIPTQIVKPLAIRNHLVCSPLNDKDTPCYTVLSKQSHSFNELVFFSAKVTSYMVQTENQSEHKPPTTEHILPISITPEKHSSILYNCTLHDITQLLDPCN